MKLSISGIFLFFLLVIPFASLAADTGYTYLEPPDRSVVAARFTPDSTRIISLDYKGVLIEWDFRQDRIIQRHELGKKIAHG